MKLFSESLHFKNVMGRQLDPLSVVLVLKCASQAFHLLCCLFNLVETRLIQLTDVTSSRVSFSRQVTGSGCSALQMGSSHVSHSSNNSPIFQTLESNVSHVPLVFWSVFCCPFSQAVCDGQPVEVIGVQ